MQKKEVEGKSQFSGLLFQKVVESKALIDTLVSVKRYRTASLQQRDYCDFRGFEILRLWLFPSL
ncbi:MAG TPA: hypothetical protein VI864_00770 [Candidatus Bathyarchaeia archaeon]|nr:hypothetical protein [Candidatus Bathyarchaeia archaeon]